MANINIRNLTLMAVVAICFLQLGAQMFAISVVASTLAEAPPRSFAILEGEHRYDSGAFWATLPPITALLFVIALVANWKTRRRLLVLAAFGLFVLAGLLAGILLEPLFASMTQGGFRDVVDPALRSRARQWYALDWTVWSLGLAAGIALLLALNTAVGSPETRGRRGGTVGSERPDLPA